MQSIRSDSNENLIEFIIQSETKTNLQLSKAKNTAKPPKIQY